jgi:hypothetical protein
MASVKISREETLMERREQKQPREVEAFMNGDGVDNHHITTT